MIEILLKRHLQGVSARSVLDVGPGYADFSRISAQVTGATSITFVDNDERVLAWQTEECDKIGMESRSLRRVIGAEKLGLEDSYDIVHCQEVLEHLSDPGLLLSQLQNKLSSHGKIIISVPTRISERWLKFLNSTYMWNEPYGHVQEFNERKLRLMLKDSGLRIVTLIPTQPHYFLSHSWMALARMKIEGSSGKVLTQDWRASILRCVNVWSRKIFLLTGMTWWGYLLPRNYFIIAARDQS
ncbi:MAG TPA: class I SAM-dependent methyltransferase [Bacteroidota bacterium]|jgi:SAM-dependent methyltransferase